MGRGHTSAAVTQAEAAQSLGQAARERSPAAFTDDRLVGSMHLKLKIEHYGKRKAICCLALPLSASVPRAEKHLHLSYRADDPITFLATKI